MLNATATALCLQVLSLEPEDHRAVAVPRHGGTPDKTRNSAQARQPRLNAKLRAPGNRTAGLAAAVLASTPPPRPRLPLAAFSSVNSLSEAASLLGPCQGLPGI